MASANLPTALANLLTGGDAILKPAADVPAVLETASIAASPSVPARVCAHTHVAELVTDAHLEVKTPVAAGVAPRGGEAKLTSTPGGAAHGVDGDSGLKSMAEAKTFVDATQYVLDIIHAPQVSRDRADLLMEETIQFWTDHVNPAFLKYRKSVAEGKGFAALEWRDGRPGGSTLIDAAGNEFIDVLAGFGIYSCGHSHPTIVSAVKAQMEKQSIHSQELLDPLRAYCAELLARTLPGDLKYAFFTNSGTESVEACLKFAIASTGRRHFVGVLGAFHGKTLGSLSATSKSAFRKAFAGSLLPFSHVPVNDIEALRRVFEASRFTGNEIAGFIVEPVMGEGGIHVCTDEYLREARRLCDEYGACLIFDEVQSGVGRTGYMWACEHAGVAPDLMAIGKGFGGGVMGAGACVGTEKVWEKYLDNPFLFTTTFGGNPLSMAAAIATLHVLHADGLVEAAATKGDWFMRELQRLRAAYPQILKEVRGRGLMLGLEFHDDEIGYAFARGAFTRRILISGTLVNSRVLRVEPPLTITQEEMSAVISRFEDTLSEMAAGGMGNAVAQPTPTSAALSNVSAPLPSVPEAAASVAPLEAAGSEDSTDREDADPQHQRRYSEDAATFSSRMRAGSSDTEVSDVSTDTESDKEANLDPRSTHAAL